MNKTPPPRLTILQTEWSTGWGGQEIRTLDEIRGLQDRFNFIVACRPEAEFGRQTQASGVPVVHLPFKGRLDLATIRGLRQLIRREAIDLIHTHSSIDAYCGGLAGRLTGTPIVRGRHLTLTEKPGVKLRLVYDWMADRVLCSSEQIRQALLTGLSCHPDHAVTLRAGIDLARFQLPDDKRKAVRRRIRENWKLKPSTFVIGIVAMLRLKKGHLTLLEAFSQVLRTIPDAHVLIVGEGPARAIFEQRIIELNLQTHVTLTGYQPDVAAYYAAIDLSVTPSYEEACSQTVMQSMASGVPVICSDVGGLPEVVTQHITGQLVPPQHVEALAASLLKSHQEPDWLHGMTETAARFAQDHFSRHQQLESLARLYQQIATLKRSG